MDAMDLMLHHVGVLVKDIAAAAKDYTERLGYELKSGVIHDPRQTAYVQFLRLPGDRVYLELVSPDRATSKLTNALNKGGGLNHVCYATLDIEQTCSQLRAQRLFQISAPVPAVAFNGRRIAWFMGPDQLLMELVERGPENEL